MKHLIQTTAFVVFAIAALTCPVATAAAVNMSNTLSIKTTLNLATAKAIAAAAEAEARRQQLRVSIAILDEAGRLLLFQRMEDTPNASVDVSIGKALHAVNYRRDTVFHQELLGKGALPVLGLPGTLPVEGGVMLKHDDAVIGAIGVSGAQASQDGEIANAGAAVLATATVPGAR